MILDKIRYSLLIPEFLRDLAYVMTYGAIKYIPFNWVTLTEDELYDKIQRHLIKFKDSDCSSMDDETGKSHLVHAACNIMMLYAILYYKKHYEIIYSSNLVQKNATKPSTIITKQDTSTEFSV